MRKIALLIIAVLGFTFVANAQQCSFDVAKIAPLVNSSEVTVSIRVTIAPTSTPTEKGNYVVVIKPKGEWRYRLEGQKTLTFRHDGNGRWDYREQSVTFNCSMRDNSYNQCTENNFEVTCYKRN